MLYVMTPKQNKSRDPKNHNNKWFIICTYYVLNSLNAEHFTTRLLRRCRSKFI